MRGGHQDSLPGETEGLNQLGNELPYAKVFEIKCAACEKNQQRTLREIVALINNRTKK